LRLTRLTFLLTLRLTFLLALALAFLLAAIVVPSFSGRQGVAPSATLGSNQSTFTNSRTVRIRVNTKLRKQGGGHAASALEFHRTPSGRDTMTTGLHPLDS
jgi:hypothetical protein